MTSARDRQPFQRLRTHSRMAIDAAACLALLGFTIPATFDPEVGNGGSPFGAILLPAVLAPVLVRYRAPLVAATGLLAGMVVSALPTFDQFRITAAIPAALLIVYSSGSRSPWRQALAGLAFVLASVVVLGLTDSGVRSSGGGGVVATILFGFPLCTGMWAAGRVVWSRDRVAAELDDRTAQLALQRERTAAAAVEIERSRLAVALDTTAQQRLRMLVELARGAPTTDRFARIERLGRGSLDELRGLLGVLRSDQRGDRVPPPTLSQLDELLESIRAGGRLVALEIDGEPRPLGAGLELAVYRAIQHALGAVDGTREAATVRLRYLPAALEIEIDGPSRGGAAAAAALVAARERVAAYGARLGETGLLTARIPAAAGA